MEDWTPKPSSKMGKCAGCSNQHSDTRTQTINATMTRKGACPRGWAHLACAARAARHAVMRNMLPGASRVASMCRTPSVPMHNTFLTATLPFPLLPFSARCSCERSCSTAVGVTIRSSATGTAPNVRLQLIFGFKSCSCRAWRSPDLHRSTALAQAASPNPTQNCF